MTPEENMQLQLYLGSDVAMCLDSMPLLHESKEKIAEAVRKRSVWAVRCKQHHDALQHGVAEKRQLLFGIVQGGIHADLREQSAYALKALDFDGYAIGGLSLGEKRTEEMQMINVVKNLLQEEKPVYLMGAGNPVELLEAIACGCDMFDSRFPTQSARHGTLFSWQGRVSIKSARCKEDTGPIDAACSCLVCTTYSKAYVRHLLTQEEGVGLRLASYHNLYFLQELMRRARTAIREGRYAAFVEEFKKTYGTEQH